MTDWYHWFLACVFLLWATSVPADRNALRIVLIASLASEALVELVTRQIHAPWKLAIPGAVETLTILALLQWSRNNTGRFQAYLLTFAWLAHAACYVDVILGTDLVYSRYEAIIMAVAVGQIAGFHETIAHIFRRSAAGFHVIRRGGLRSIPAASGCDRILPDAADNFLSTRD